VDEVIGDLWTYRIEGRHVDEHGVFLSCFEWMDAKTERTRTRRAQCSGGQRGIFEEGLPGRDCEGGNDGTALRREAFRKGCWASA
jgi:hypothetical protein